MFESIEDVIDLDQHALQSNEFQASCQHTLDEDGVLVLRNFLRPAAITKIIREAEKKRHLAYYTVNNHNIYLTTPDPDYPRNHPRNREVSSSKGCITTDQIPGDSPLHMLYDALEFRTFSCAVLGERELYEYADALSSINLHYADQGQELGWHFDNSSFAITLMIQSPECGGAFEYVRDVRDADSGEMKYELAGKVLDGEVTTRTLSMDDGDLVLFRGRNSMHRVTPVVGSRTRMLVVLAYNTEPGISLSKSAQLTFYGRRA